MDTTAERIGIFGGTFDPVHNGHLAIAESFLKSNHIDQLWVLLNPDPPHKKEEQFASYAARLQMLQAAFASMDEVMVSDLETTLPRPAYTVRTLRYLHDHYPGKTYYLCIGEDSLHTFPTWYEWREILTYCTLLVARRPVEQDPSLPALVLEHTVFADHQPIKVSSSDIRKRLASGEPVDDLVPGPVRNIIEQQHLYTV